MKSTIKTLGLVGFSFLAGYIAAGTKLRNSYLDMLNEEVHKNRLEYKERLEDVKKKLQERATEDAAEALVSYQTGIPSRPVQYSQVAASDPVPTEEVLVELPQPEPQAIVITEDDFLNGEFNYDDKTLTYYAKDRVIADQTGVVINQQERTEWFGDVFGQELPLNESNAFYVRNHNVGMDFEVVVSDGSYKEEVLGGSDSG